MRDGLGLCYAFMGPMETIHLNALGLKKYCETYGETISNVSKTMGDIPSSWLMETEEDKAKVINFSNRNKQEIVVHFTIFSSLSRSKNYISR